MRMARIKEKGAYYHIMSRVIDRQMLLDDVQKERLRRIMRSVAGFSGVQILTWTVLDNHFHILLYVPAPQPVSDEELIRRLRLLYDTAQLLCLEKQLRGLREEGHDAAAEVFKARYTYRMYEISEFVKTLKQRFTQNYNAQHNRTGTLWEGRFKSILVQDSEYALFAIAAYIDLNAVRAGLVSDPKDYRFCGYGEAMGGSWQARRGISSVLLSLEQSGSWRQKADRYRTLLYMAGEQQGSSRDGAATKRGFNREKVKEVLQEGGTLTLQELLHCRVRYFTDGMVLGSRAYVQEVFLRHRCHFSDKRKTAPRSMTGEGWGNLCTARRLRLEAIAVAGIA